MKKLSNFYHAMFFLVLSFSFTNIANSQGSIGNYIWEDTNQDGFQDLSESGISNVHVFLYTETGNFVDISISNDQGNYDFEEVPTGDYYMVFDPSYTHIAYEPTNNTGVLEDDDNSDITYENGTAITPVFHFEETISINYIDAGFIRSYCEPVNDKACEDLFDFDLTEGGELPDEQTNICSFAELFFDDCESEAQKNAVFYTFTLKQPFSGIKINITPSGSKPITGTIVAGISYVDDDFCHNDVNMPPAYCQDIENAEFIWNCLEEGTYQIRISTSKNNAGTFNISSSYFKSEDNPCAINNKCENAEELKIENTCIWNDFEDKCNEGACPEDYSIGKCDLSTGPTVWYKFLVPVNATFLDINVDNIIHSNFDFIVFDESNACGLSEGWCGEGGSLKYPIDVTEKDGEYYYLAITGKNGIEVKFDIHIKFEVPPINDSPCMNDDANPPFDLGLNGSHQGTTCCAIGYNDDPEKDYSNEECGEESDFNTVWYRAEVDSIKRAIHIVVSDIYFGGDFAIEVYSGGENAICEGNAKFLEARCNEFPKTDIKLNLVCSEDNFVFIKVSSSDSETNCANFNISAEPVKVKIAADNCTSITELNTISPHTPSEVEIKKYCICGTLESSTPNQGLPQGCSAFDTNPTSWIQIITDKDANHLFSYVTTEGNWTPVWSVFYSLTGDCLNLINAADLSSFNCSLEAFPQAPPLMTNIAENGLYYLVVSAKEGDVIDDPNFEICVATIDNNESCIGLDNGGCQPDNSLVFNINYREYDYFEPDGPPYFGPFYPEEKVKVHVEYLYDATKAGDSWLMGIFPRFGNGWNLDSFDFSAFPPEGIGKSAEWYDEKYSCRAFATKDLLYLSTYVDENGNLQLCNMLCEDCPNSKGIKEGQFLPSGYFWVQEGSSPDCDAYNCSPSYKYGIGNPVVNVSWDLNLQVKKYSGEQDTINNNDLSISFLALSDDVIGCWDDPSGICQISFTQFSPPWKVEWKDITPPLKAKYNLKNNKCYGDCSGSISIKNIENGIEPFNYLWSTGDTTKSVTGLCSGDFSLTITDASNKSLEKTFVITSPTNILAQMTATSESANNENDGTASTNPMGGTPPYYIKWNTGNTTRTISNLKPGKYYVTITDAVDCSITDSIKVKEYECSLLEVYSNIQNVNCFGDCDGSIEITNIDNAVLPLEYKWNTGDTTPLISNLCKGKYLVSITDAKNCQIIDTFNISEPEDITIVIDSTSDIGQPHSGSISISTNANYLYSWVGPCDFMSTNQDIDSLNCAGCYLLTVIDTTSNCKKDTSICINTTGTIEFKKPKKDIKIYPNPTKDYVIIDFSQINIENANINIYDISGKMKYTSFKKSKDLLIHVGTKSLETGLYIIEIKVNKNIFYKKLVIGR